MTDATPPRPSLDEAFEFVRPAYDVALRRAESIEARTRATATLAGTFMFAAPALAAAAFGPGSRSVGTVWFILGAAAFAGVLLCLVAQQVPHLVGELQVLSLEVLGHEDYLRSDPADFKLNLLIYGGQAWQLNREHLAKLGQLSIAAAALFVAQVVSLATWVLHG
jgi:hypothetical protein